MNRQRARISLFLLLAVICFNSIAQNQLHKPSSPTQQQVGAKNSKSSDDQRGTKNSPLIVETLESQNDQAEKLASAKHREQEAVNSRNIMYFTGAMAFIGLAQIGFFYWQLSLMRRSLQSAEIAAKAAELNARAAIGIELPIIRAVPADLVSTAELIGGDEPYGGTVNDFSPAKYSAIGPIVFKNYGRTPAFPEKLSVGWIVATILPDVPTYRETKYLNHAAVIKPDSEFTADRHYGIELTDEELAATSEGKSWLWVYGCLYYRDFLHENRQARFCWRFANRNFDTVFYFFSSDGEPPAEYTRHV